MDQQTAYNFHIDPFVAQTLIHDTFVNSEDPDEMPQNVAFHQGLHCLQRQLELSENLTTAQLQCFACSKRPELLRILSVNVILTSIKGHNSLTNLRKLTANNPNLDLVSINSYIKFGEIQSICSQDIERNDILA